MLLRTPIDQISLVFTSVYRVFTVVFTECLLSVYLVFSVCVLLPPVGRVERVCVCLTYVRHSECQFEQGA